MVGMIAIDVQGVKGLIAGVDVLGVPERGHFTSVPLPRGGVPRGKSASDRSGRGPA